jgi:dTMP kinase
VYRHIVLPNLQQGNYVIQDRSWPSTIAYQVFAGGLDLNHTQQIIKFATQSIESDLVIYLAIPIEKYEETFKIRVNACNERLNSFEKNGMDYFEKVFNGYEYLYENNKNNWIKIDALQTPEEIYKQIVQEIEKRFN